MKFVNKGESIQVRENDGPGRYKWILLKTGETIDLPEDVGIRYGLKKMKIDTTQREGISTTEGKIGKKKVETKQIEDFSKIKVPEFEKELTKIKGIGAKTAWDITKVFPTKEKLKYAISHDDELPFRDDVEEKLRREYGK